MSRFSKRRLIRIGTIIGLIFCGIVSALLILELLLTVTNYQKRTHIWLFQNEEFLQEGKFRSFYTIDSEEIFKTKPNARPDPDYWEIDAHGFRVHPTQNSDPSAKRILIIGDSYAYGHGVSHEEAWPAVLEKKLNATGNNVTVFNAAVPSTGTDSQFMRMRKYAESVRPDNVIWMVANNDIEDSNLACLFTPAGNGYRQVPAYQNIAYINAWLIKYLPKPFIETRTGNILTTLSVYGNDLYTLGCSRQTDTQTLRQMYFKKLTYLLGQARALSETNDFDLLVVLAPKQAYFNRQNDTTSDDVSILTRFIQAFQTSGVSYLDMNTEIAKEHDAVLFKQRTNNAIPHGTLPSTNPDLQISLFLQEAEEYGVAHLNAVGNTIIAEILWNTLAEKGLRYIK